jgi:hypothetical protein
MFSRFKLASLTVLTIGGACFGPAALADSWNKETVVTFNQAVEVPGRVLQPGSYIFKLTDSASTRTIVEIYTADDKRFVTRVMAIPAYQLDTPDTAIVTLTERGAGPEVVHRWFYPGDSVGIEFVYPKSARQFEAGVQPAPVAAPEPPAALPEPPQVEAADRVTEPESPMILVPEQPLTPVGAPEPTSVAETDTTADALPQTSSTMAMLPFAGVVLLFGGFAAMRFAAARG